MAEPGDILDEFDDDTLRRSIEGADKGGQWRDPSAKFEDPKLTQLARRLAEAPRTSYAERRLRELERRAAETAKPAPIAAPAPVFAETPMAAKAATRAAPAPAPAVEIDTNWRQTLVRAGQAPMPLAPAEELRPPDSGRTTAIALATAGSLGCAIAVFGIGLAAQVAITGWATHYGVRAAIAATFAGILGQLFGDGRFRAAAIGTAIHLVAFISTGSATTGQDVFGTFLGTLLVLIGSGAVGLMREENASPHRPTGR